MQNIVVLHGEGIGNCIELLPTLATLKNMGFSLYYCHLFGSFNVPAGLLSPYIADFISVQQCINIDIRNFVGKVSTLWGKNHVDIGNLRGLPLLNTIQNLKMTRSEVDTYMDIARDLGARKKELIWHAECSYKKSNKYYDVVLNNGYNRVGSANWVIKSYQYYDEVVRLLKKDFKICSIGGKEEYINNTDDQTGLPLLESLGVVKNAKLLIGNDSGVYHCANSLSVPNITIFTATSIEKNYDSRFHKFSKLIYRDDLECRPCQYRKGWKNCKSWDCREIPPERIVEEARFILRGEK